MYREQLGRQETSHQTLLSRIDKKTSGRPPNLPHRLPSLPLATSNLDLKQRLWNQNRLPDLPLSPSQPSTRMSSSTAMPSSRSTERGKMSKPTVYSKIRAKLASSLEEDTDRIDSAFGSFIATVESHDSETAMAARRGARGGVRHRAQSPFSNVSEPSSDEEPVTKKSKIDESAFAWTGPESQTNTKLSDNLVRTLKLL